MTALNVLGTPLVPCSYDPLTGLPRRLLQHRRARPRHACDLRTRDAGVSDFPPRENGDLITPRPEYRFAGGLRPNNRWCLCALRWKETWRGRVAPPVILESTHACALDFVTLEQLPKRR